MTDDTEASESTPAARPPRRSGKRVFWGIVLLLLGCLLFGTGVDAVLDPAAVVAGSSNTPRSPDNDAEAVFGGVLMCLFGIIVFGFGIGLLRLRPGESMFGKAA